MTQNRRYMCLCGSQNVPWKSRCVWNPSPSEIFPTTPTQNKCFLKLAFIRILFYKFHIEELMCSLCEEQKNMIWGSVNTQALYKYAYLLCELLLK